MFFLPQIILEHGVDEVGEKRFLIPSLLKRKQEDNMWTSFNEENCPFYYIIGRTCLSSITLNPSTVAVIQHVLGNRGKDLHATIDFFQDGLIMAHEELIIIMNAILLHSGVCIKIGVRKDDCKPNRSELKSLIVKSKKLMDEFFTRMCCGIVSEKNPSSSQERHVISLVGMMKGSDKISYPLSEVQNKFQDKVRLLHFCPAKDVKGDRTTLLLTQLETASKDNEVLSFLFIERVRYSCTAHCLFIILTKTEEAESACFPDSLTWEKEEWLFSLNHVSLNDPNFNNHVTFYIQ